MEWTLQRETPRAGGTPGVLTTPPSWPESWPPGRTHEAARLYTLEDRVILANAGTAGPLEPWECFVKIPGQTAIPAGRYRVILSFSKRFGRMMPEILGVPDFASVRFHGGNTEADTAGCPLVGIKRTDRVTHQGGTVSTVTGIRNCATAVAHLTALVKFATEPVWVTVINPSAVPIVGLPNVV